MLLLRRLISRETLRASGLLRMKVLQPAIYSPFQLHTEDIKKPCGSESSGGYHGDVEQSQRLGCVSLSGT